MPAPAYAFPHYPGHMPDPLYAPAPPGGFTGRMLAALTVAIRDQPMIAGFRVYDVRVEGDWVPELDEEFVRVRLLMEDPAPGELAWPLEESQVLDRTICQLARRLGIRDKVDIQHVALRRGNRTRSGFTPEAVARARNADR